MALACKDFREYSIRDGKKDLEAVVAPELGGMLTGFKVKGKEILYISEAFLKKRNILAGGFPILFPVCGSLDNGKYKIGGKEYRMPQHGFARTCEWAVEDEETRGNSITLRLTSSDKTKQWYPFDFTLRQTYRFSDGILSIRLETANHSEAPMPAYPGYHPYLIATDKHAIEFSINAKSFINYNTGQVEDYNGTIDFSRPVDHVFFHLTSRVHSYWNKRDGYLLKMTLDEKMKALVVWTMKTRPFICLEPWTAKPNALNTGEDLCIIAPGGKADMEMKLEIEMAGER